MKYKVMKITEFHIELSKKNVLSFLDVDENSDLYEEISCEFEEMLPRAYELIKPAVLLAFGDISDYGIRKDGETVETALYGINTVGAGLSEWSTELFAEGDYLKGMLADAMADDYLFQIDQAVQTAVVEMCKKKRVRDHPKAGSASGYSHEYPEKGFRCHRCREGTWTKNKGKLYV